MRLSISFLALLVALHVHAETNRSRLVDSIARQISDRYVLIEAASSIAGRLQAKQRSGTYDQLDVGRLADALTNDLREISGDLHFHVQYDPALASRLTAAGAGTRRRLPEVEPAPEEIERMRRSNFGFRQVEMLPGNVGLLEITRFEDLTWSRDAATAAMAFLANADAVIVDLRGNPGGSGNIVGFVTSYFFAGPVDLMATFDRETGKTARSRTLARLPGRRLPDIPLFLLIGPGTGSAAEAFAFALQITGRATLVGERSQGAGHGGGWVPVTDGFVVYIPTFRPFDPRTGKGWEKVGVQPDLAAAGGRALVVAHLAAVTSLEKRAPLPERRWLLPLLGLEAHGAAEADLTGLAGSYKGIEISLAGGALTFLGASGILRPAVALSDGTFLIEDASVPATAQARMRFVRDAAGAVTGLELLTAAGQVIPRPRL